MNRQTRIRLLASLPFLILMAGLFGSRSSMETLAKPAATPGASGYHIAKTIPIGGDGGWDYIAADPVGRRIYISHGPGGNSGRRLAGAWQGIESLSANFEKAWRKSGPRASRSMGTGAWVALHGWQTGARHEKFAD